MVLSHGRTVVLCGRAFSCLCPLGTATRGWDVLVVLGGESGFGGDSFGAAGGHYVRNVGCWQLLAVGWMFCVNGRFGEVSPRRRPRQIERNSAWTVRFKIINHTHLKYVPIKRYLEGRGTRTAFYFYSPTYLYDLIFFVFISRYQQDIIGEVQKGLSVWRIG